MGARGRKGEKTKTRSPGEEGHSIAAAIAREPRAVPIYLKCFAAARGWGAFVRRRGRAPGTARVPPPPPSRAGRR